MQGYKVPMVLIAGNSHPELSNLISNQLGMSLCPAKVFHRSNRETAVDIQATVRGKDVYILQTGTKDVNNDITELLVIAYACKTAAARKVIGVVPYLPYSKQCKRKTRSCVVTKLLASMLSKAGFDHLITMDLHRKEIQGFFDCPVDNLRASPFMVEYIKTQIPDYKNSVIVARNLDSVNRAASYAERLKLGLAVIHGERKLIPVGEEYNDLGMIESDSSDDSDEEHASAFGQCTTATSFPGLVPGIPAKEKPPMHIVGDTGGHIAIMITDILDDVEAFVAAADLLCERGAYRIYVLATHGLLSADAPRLISESKIDEVVVTNTIPHEVQKIRCHKIKTVDISSLLTESIRRIHNLESMSALFSDITCDD